MMLNQACKKSLFRLVFNEFLFLVYDTLLGILPVHFALLQNENG